MIGFPLFIFGLVFAVFHIAPALLTNPTYGILTSGDAFDFLTPLALLSALAWVCIRIKGLHPLDPHRRFRRLSVLSLLALGALAYVDGHGMHLATNALGRLVYASQDQVVSGAVYFFDETLSHILNDSGVILISLGLLLWARRLPVFSLSRKELGWLLAGGLLFGFTFFANGVEGQTVPLTLPAAVLLLLFSLYTWLGARRLKRKNPVVLFFMTSFSLALILFLIWQILYPGLTEFSAVGWI